MGGLAICMTRMGYRVGGSDQGVYPPMSDMLAEAGVDWKEGFARLNLGHWLDEHPRSLVVVGNAIPRGNPELEEALARGCVLSSLPEILRRDFLPGRRSVVVSGTHGKTTTTNLAAWLLERLGLEPGWMVGGKPWGLEESLRPAAPGHPLVLEGDEYDTVFYDKRSKFFHYWPQLLVVNHVEFDHADIFEDLAPIRTAFRRLVNQVPESGLVLLNAETDTPCAVAARSLAPLVGFGATPDAAYRLLDEGPVSGGSRFTLALPEDPAWLAGLGPRPGEEPAAALEALLAERHPGREASRLTEDELAALGRLRLMRPERQVTVEVEAALSGAYNGRNLLAALAVVDACGGDRARALGLVREFQGPARRMDGYSCAGGLLLYDDFGHHPTAVREALDALRKRHPGRCVTAVVEPRSNTSVRNVMQREWMEALAGADGVVMGALHRPWKYDAAELFDFGLTRDTLAARGVAFHQEDDPARIADMLLGLLAERVPDPAWKAHAATPADGQLWVIFSNGSFGGLRQRLLEALRGAPPSQA